MLFDEQQGREGRDQDDTYLQPSKPISRPKEEDLFEMERRLWMGKLRGIEAFEAEAILAKFPPSGDCD